MIDMLCLSLVYSYMYMYVYALIVCILLLGGNKGIYLSRRCKNNSMYDPLMYTLGHHTLNHSYTKFKQ